MIQLRRLTDMTRKKLYYGLAIAAVGICIIGVITWKGQSKEVVQNVTVVRTAVIGTLGASQGYTYSGEVRGRYERQLGFPVNTAIPYTGTITKRNVDVGSVVKPGDVLLQMDARDLQQTANTYSAQVYSAESQLKLAEKNLSRYRQLYSQGAISRATLDQYESAYDVAVAGVQQSAAQYNQSSNQINASTIYADTAGVVSSISAEVGQIVSAGQPVITVVQDGEREIEISVPENRIEELRQVRQIRVGFWAFPNVRVEGKIREIAPMADKVTRTFRVRVSLVNPPEEIKLGMTASVTLGGNNSQQAVSIPLAAIYQSDDKPAVWVVTGETLALRPVITGDFGNGTVQVLSGLEQGERIVIAGVHKLKEGQSVKVTGDSL